MTNPTLGGDFLAVVTNDFTRLKEMAEKVFQQLDDGDLFYKPDDESNSIAVIVKHMAGNMRSRWTGFLTSDGEKPDRNRDGEFVDEGMTREQLMSAWNDGWGRVFDVLAGLGEADLERTVYIRGEPHTVVRAVVRQLVHYAHHVGQIAYIGKHRRGAAWESLSIPKGRSREYRPRTP
jgi:hypothetical protein